MSSPRWGRLSVCRYQHSTACNVDPRLRTSLYPALSNLDVSPATRPSTVKVLRVKAAPFGASIPKKPIVREGATIESEEWLLSSASLDLELPSVPVSIPAPNPSDPGTVGTLAGIPFNVTVARGGDPEKASGNLALPAIALKSVTVVVTPSANQVQFAFFTAGAPDGSPAFATITVILTRNNSVLDVKIGDEPSRQVSPFQARIRDALFGNEVDIVYTASPPSGGNPSLIVREVVPMTLPFDAWNILALDAVYDHIVPESWVVIERAERSTTLALQVHRVVNVATVAHPTTGSRPRSRS